MTIKFSEQLFFCYNCPTKTKKTTKRGFYISLLTILIGIFLSLNICYSSNISEEKIIELTNQERIKQGLNIVTANQLLTKAAYEKGETIMATQNFQHTINGKKFSNWIKDAGYKYSYVGENLALDFVTSEGAIKAWLNSPTHKKNILNQYFTETGVAVMERKFQGNNTVLIVQIFGSPPQKILTANKANNYPQNKPLISKNNLPLNIQTAQTFNFNDENFLTHSTIALLNGKQATNKKPYNNKFYKQNSFENPNIFFPVLNIKIFSAINYNRTNYLLTILVIVIMLITIYIHHHKKLFYR